VRKREVKSDPQSSGDARVPAWRITKVLRALLSYFHRLCVCSQGRRSHTGGMVIMGDVREYWPRIALREHIHRHGIETNEKSERE
jgi:hypothetical protein